MDSMPAQPNETGSERIDQNIDETFKEEGLSSIKDRPDARKETEPLTEEEIKKSAREALRKAGETLLRELPDVKKGEIPEFIRISTNRLSIDLGRVGYGHDARKALSILLKNELDPTGKPDDPSRGHWRNDEETVGKVVEAIDALEKMIESESQDGMI